MSVFNFDNQKTELYEIKFKLIECFYITNEVIGTFSLKNSLMKKKCLSSC